MWGYYNYYYGPMHFFGGILSILWWIFVIWAIVHVVRWLKRDGKHRLNAMVGNSALNLLKERYAKGEIDKAEFDQKKKDLE